MKSLDVIRVWKSGDIGALHGEKWLTFLTNTEERNINLERLSSVSELANNVVLDYVERTLQILEDCDVSPKVFDMLETTLKWSEVAKSGSFTDRQHWLNQGINLYAHNEGSAKIYLLHHNEPDAFKVNTVHDFILTHGLLGQFLRGEVNLKENEPLGLLLKKGILTRDELTEALYNLNKCILGAVSIDLWNFYEPQVQTLISNILAGNFGEHSLSYRIQLLRTESIKAGERIDSDSLSESFKKVMEDIFSTNALWYVEPALHDFSFEEFTKVFALTHASGLWKISRHLSFDKFMKHIYYDYNGQKRVNVYKKRIIENYLASLSLEDILEGKIISSPHVEHVVEQDPSQHDTIFFNFNFSAAGSKLIEFCVEAEKAGLEYEKAPLLLFDLFGLRKDKYDRFNNEDEYLATMNSSIDYKKVILNHIVGDTVLDIGPGGGVMLDLIEEHMPNVQPVGLDISTNVVDALNKKKSKEGKKWKVMQGDALDLPAYFEEGEVTTILFSSILHEIFSYQEYEGRLFNHKVIGKALLSAYNVLPVGGRIIIRDGIMTDPKDTRRKVEFHCQDGMKYLAQYQNDFKGRQIEYIVIGENTVTMPINDAMEFLYTYTWGPDSYAHEVQEQFGYFTPNEYEACIKETLGDTALIVENKYYLQEGYSEALMPKISIFDLESNKVSLPNSTCLIVIEKTH